MNTLKSNLLKENKIHLEIMLTRKCNLKCNSCCFFSNIANDNSVYDLTAFKNDIEYMKNTNIKIASVALIGGEVLLIKNICDYINIIRENFSDINICVFTNGLKLINLDKNIIDNFIKNDVITCLTYYPIKLLNLIKNKQKELLDMGFKVYRHQDDVAIKKDAYRDYWQPTKFDFNSKEEDNFLKCKCDIPQLYNSKIYTCSVAANVFAVKEKYNLPVYENTGIDLKQIKSNDDFIKFTQTPNQNCKHCFRVRDLPLIKWTTNPPKRSDYI